MGFRTGYGSMGRADPGARISSLPVSSSFTLLGCGVQLCPLLGSLLQDVLREEARCSPENRFGVIWVGNSRVLLTVSMERMRLQWKCNGSHIIKNFLVATFKKVRKKQVKSILIIIYFNI